MKGGNAEETDGADVGKIEGWLGESEIREGKYDRMLEKGREEEENEVGERETKRVSGEM